MTAADKKTTGTAASPLSDYSTANSAEIAESKPSAPGKAGAGALANSAAAEPGGAPTQSRGITARFNLGIAELTFLFVLAFALRFSFNFIFSHVNNFAACDAFEYISNGQALLQVFAEPLSFWQKSIACLSGSANAADWVQVKSFLAPLKDFYISGPVFPAFLALLAAASGGTAHINVHHLWQALLAGNSLVSALTCVFIALIANEAFGKRSARIAGLLAAIYPGFIVNSGRLYSETFATFLLVALSYITLAGFRNGGNNFILTFASGFLAAALQLSRSVMAVLTLALLPITAIQQKGLRRLSFLFPFAFGFLLVALPWLGFQKLAFGGGGLVVDRVGHYNFFIGNNVDTQGWLSYPYPDGRNVEATTFPRLWQTAVKKSPARWIRLMLDKPLRLFQAPWNDFRTAIGPWQYKWQLVFHELVVLLACLGIGLALLLSVNRAPERRQLYCRLYLVGLFAFHFIYCLFITVPRYNLTAMPELIVFAAAGVALTFQLLVDQARSRSRAGAVLLAAFASLFVLLNNNLMPFFVAAGAPAESAWILQAFMRFVAAISCLAAVIMAARTLQGQRHVAIALASFLALAALPLLVIPLRASGRYLEWHQNLSASSAPLQQTIKLPVAVCRQNPAGLFLLLDSEGVRQHADGLELLVNGQRLSGPVLASMSFAENFDRFLELGPKTVQREGERMWDSLSNSAGCGNLDLRQWSMILLPESVLQSAVARADSEHCALVTLDVSIKNLSSLALKIYGSYSVNDRERILPSLDLYSWEKVFYGVENPDGLSDTRYDIKIPAATLVATKRDLSDLPGLQNGVLNMAVLVPPPLASLGVSTGSTAPGATSNSEIERCSSRVGKASGSEVRLIASKSLGAVSVNTAGGTSVRVKLSDMPAEPDSLWILRLRGRSRVKSGNACPAAEIDCQYGGQKSGSYTYKSTWSPRRLPSSAQWHDFEFVVPIKPYVENASAKEAIVNLKLVSPESAYLNIQRPFGGESNFADLVLDVYQLPSNPIGLGPPGLLGVATIRVYAQLHIIFY